MKTYETSVKFGLYYDQAGTMLMLKAAVSLPQYKQTKLIRFAIINTAYEPAKFIIKYQESVDNTNLSDTQFRDSFNLKLGPCSPSPSVDVRLSNIADKNPSIYHNYTLEIELFTIQGVVSRIIYTGISDDADIDYLESTPVTNA